MENNTDFFYTPDYYDNFRCKGGSCRNTCCMGYSVGISMPEYFRLVGLTCSDDLRRRLDCGLKVREKPEKTDYAVIEPDWFGRCHALGEDGLCLLQKEQGARVLPAVCRYYPRSPKRKYDSECSCATACEEVLELLFHRSDPMTFSVRKLSFDMELEKRDEDSGKIREYPYVHKKIIGLMQQREYSIDRRIENIGRELSGCTDPVPAISLLPENKDADIQVLAGNDRMVRQGIRPFRRLRTGERALSGRCPRKREEENGIPSGALEKDIPGIDLFFEHSWWNDMMFMYCRIRTAGFPSRTNMRP